MKVNLGTVDLDDDYRRMIAWYQDRPKGDPQKCRLATRKECRDWMLCYGKNIDEDARYEMDMAIEEFRADAE